MTPNPNPSLLYHPAWNALTGSPLATLLLGQIRYWWNTMGGQPFYKYAAPCPAAAPGDSWLEELGFSRRQFESARDRIATKITRGVSRQQALETSLVIYWTDASRRTWYQLNEPLLLRRLAELESQTAPPVAQSPPVPQSPPPPPDDPAHHHRATSRDHCLPPHSALRALNPVIASEATPASATRRRCGAGEQSPPPIKARLPGGTCPATLPQPPPAPNAHTDHHPVPNAQNVQYPTTAHNPQPMLMPVSANAYTETNTQTNHTDVGGGVVSVSVDQALADALARLGDSNPRDLLARYPAERVRAWLDYCTSPAGAGLTNKPGFIRSRLSQGLTPPPTVVRRPSFVAASPPTVVRRRSLSIAAPPPSCVAPPPSPSLWDAILDELQLQMDRATFHRWLADTHLLERVDDTLRVAVPSVYVQDWLDHRLRRAIDRTLAYVAPGLSVQFVPPPSGAGETPDENPPLPTQADKLYLSIASLSPHPSSARRQTSNQLAGHAEGPALGERAGVALVDVENVADAQALSVRPHHAAGLDAGDHWPGLPPLDPVPGAARAGSTDQPDQAAGGRAGPGAELRHLPGLAPGGAGGGRDPPPPHPTSQPPHWPIPPGAIPNPQRLPFAARLDLDEIPNQWYSNLVGCSKLCFGNTYGPLRLG